MSDKLIRWMKIINIVQNRPGVTSKYLSEELEVDIRTIQRDIRDLNAANIPIISEGRGKGYTFLTPFSMYPLEWTDQERRAFYALPAILEKMQNLVPPELFSAVEKVIGADRKKRAVDESAALKWAKAVQIGTPAYPNRKDQSSRFLTILLEAIYNRRTVKTKYYTQSRKTWTTRNIDPYYLVPREHRFYVIGYCHKQQSVRTFRLSRFEHIEMLPKTFQISDFNLEQYLKHTWSIIRGADEIHFKVLFDPEVADYVKEEELILDPVFIEQEDGSLLMEVKVNHDQEFLHWLSQYRDHAEILYPLSYREKMRSNLRSWLQKYEK